MNRVIYTTLIGNYDNLKDPSVVNNDWDYICFTDVLNQEDYKVWKIIKIANRSLSNIESSRQPKLCPHLFLQDYDISVFIDSNIEITSDFIYKRSLELEKTDNLISVPIHPTRNCLYKEGEILKYRGKDKITSLKRHLAFLREENFPENYGLYENNVIWRRHMNHKLKVLGEEWWRIFRNYSKRDQLGLVYCLWKYDIACPALMPENILDHRKSEHFEFSEHHRKWYFHIKRFISKVKYVIKTGKRPDSKSPSHPILDTKKTSFEN